jgi:diguanylate cyclase (GGDEF)-like protein/PAS domain S-box-containing protein
MSEASETRLAPTSTYEALLEFLYLTPVGIMRFRPDGTVELANAAAVQLLLPLARTADLSNLYTVFAVAAPDLRARIERYRAPTGPICDQMQVAVPGSRTVLTLGINKIDPDTLMAVVQDITIAIEQELRIRADQQRFRAIFENIRDYAICIIDLDGRIDEWNRSLQRLGGWEAADVTDAAIDILFPPDGVDRAESAALLDRARQHGTAEFEGWCVRKDGNAFWGNTVATVLPDADGRATGYVLVIRDLTERKQHEDRLVALAATDPLTGAANRRSGEAALKAALLDWRRHGYGFAVLMIDCDHFKSINDRWGHDAGDAVLVDLVRICGENVREADTIIRWGGEEFLLLMPRTGVETALAVAERVRAALQDAEIRHGADVIRITVSIGVAEASANDASADSIVRRADQALYEAKDAGRNRVVRN